MATGRTLTVSLVANTKSFATGMMSAARNADGFRNKMKAMSFQMSNVAGPAFAGAAAAAGTFAAALAVQGIKAAAEQETALNRLGTVLDGLGQKFEMPQIVQALDDMQYLSGVADDELIPAFQRIVSASGDVDESMALMNTALDVAASRGVNVQEVAQAFSRALATGTAGRLVKYGIVVDEQTAKTEGMATAIQQASEYMSGAAAASAQTWEGRIKILNTATQELIESFGTGFLGAMDDAAGSSNELVTQLRELQGAASDLGENLGSAVSDTIALVGGIRDLWNWTGQLTDNMGMLGDALEGTRGSFGSMLTGSPGIGMFIDMIGQTRDFIGMMNGDLDSAQRYLGQTSDAADEAAKTGFSTLAESIGMAADEAEAAITELDKLKGVLSEIDAIFAFRDAMDEAKVAISEQTGILDSYSASGRDTIRSLLDMAEKAGAVGLTTVDMSEKIGVADQALSFLSESLNNTQMSPSTRDALLAAFQAMIDDLEEAGVNVTNLQAKLDALDGTNVNITVTTTYTTAGDPGGYPYGDKPVPTGEAMGGMVRGPGTSTSDSIPRMLSNGEFVVRAASVRKFGAAFFRQLNNGAVPAELAMTSRGSGGGGGVYIDTINVASAPGERVAESLPRSLRRMAWLAGLGS